MCILGAPPNATPPFTPNPDLKVQICEVTYYNDRFLVEATTYKLNKYTILQTMLAQQGWDVLPPIIITTSINGSIHTPTIKQLSNLKIP